MFNTPILLIIFNRPETTEKVFESIRAIKPKELYIAADGPRVEKEGEYEKCMQARRIVEKIDWDCNVKTLFRNNNLGCGVGPANAITWFFSQVEQGIILEDDCLPNKTFFNFCAELLSYYKDDDQIMHISGNNFFNGNSSNSSYYFSHYSLIWGWATWKRAWDKYDFQLSKFEDFQRMKIIERTFKNKEEQKFWLNAFDKVRDSKRVDIWDYQWAFTIWINNGLAIIPKVNLVSNIGFGEDATHTTVDVSNIGNFPTKEMVEIIHPTKKEINKKLDNQIYTKSINPPVTFINKLRNLFYFMKRFFRGKN